MPYIKKEDKEYFLNGQDWLSVPVARTKGELNFLLTKICDQYMNQEKQSYDRVNDVVGALECCKLEFYRRIAAPYEDLKIAANGDAYNPRSL